MARLARRARLRRHEAARPAAALAVLLVLLAAAAGAQPPQPVEVTNFPATQRVEGQVRVPDPVPHGRLLKTAEVLVPPGLARDGGELAAGGTLDAAGFTRAVLSLSVELRGAGPRPGDVGVVLLPDEEALLDAYEEDGRLPFALETHAAIVPGPGYRFYSGQLEVRLGFPRYRLLFYNTSDRSVTARLYTYVVH
jgi:hypothetical protein